MKNQLGIYEKALPKGLWKEKFNIAKKFKFDFIEMSIDESDERLARLKWLSQDTAELNQLQKDFNINIRSICFSGQRKYPLGSHDKNIRNYSLKLLEECIILAGKLGVRIIQLAGYDVYYEKKSEETKAWFIENLNKSLAVANHYGVMLAIEIMDDPFISTISKYLEIKNQCPSPWLSVYPDLGNLSAWTRTNVIKELSLGFDEIVALHIKDTLPVSETLKGKFKNVPFGKGCVDFISIFKFLKEKKYSGSFMIEAWYEDYANPEFELAAATNFVKNQFQKAGW